MLYQFLPRLSDDEYAALEASIREHGVQVPVLVDEHGSIIDGHHRKEIAERVGVDLPQRVRPDLSDAQKRTLALSLNIDRRHLNREQKRALVEASLTADPDLSDRAHAKRTGVDHKTVGATRERMSGGEIPHVDATPETSPRADDSVDLTTGEVHDPEPTVTEHTVTEKTRTITGLDGKTYTAPARAPQPAPAKPVPTADEAARLNAEQAAAELAHAVFTLTALDFTEHRERLIGDWWPNGNAAVSPADRAFVTPRNFRLIAVGLNQLANEWEKHYG